MVILLILFLATIRVAANDSEMYGSGSSLMPLKNARIRMVREDLTIRYRGDSAEIDVSYVFRNAGKTTTIQVGFVSPPPSQEYDEGDLTYPPPISWVWTTVNDRPVTMRTERIGKSRASEDRHVYPFDWVFLSKITFRKGLTRVKHRYKFRHGASVFAPVHIPYRLTTGTHWQGGVIDTFRLTVDGGKGRLIGVPSTFTGDTVTSLPWKPTGRAVRADSVGYHRFYDDEQRQPEMVWSIENGKLVLEQLNFAPKQDLMVTVHNGLSIYERAIVSPQSSWITGLSCTELKELRAWIESTLTFAPGSDDRDYDVDRQLLQTVKHAQTIRHCR